MPEALEQAEARLRHAVAHQEFEEMDVRIAGYCDEARRHLDSLSTQDARHRTALQHVMDVLDWARLMLCAGHAARTQQLRSAKLTNRYLGQQPLNVPSLQIDF
jgi:hypothetical protein